MGRREGNISYSQVTKYGNINLKIRITYYPTLHCEYNIVQFPTFQWQRDLYYKKVKREHLSRLTCKAVLT